MVKPFFGWHQGFTKGAIQIAFVVPVDSQSCRPKYTCPKPEDMPEALPKTLLSDGTPD